MAQQIELTNTVNDSQLGKRLDQVIAELYPDYSRTRIKDWILAGKVAVDGEIIDKPRIKMMGSEQLVINAEIEDEVRWEAQDIPLDIVYEDDDIIVINKLVTSLCTLVLVRQMVRYLMLYYGTVLLLQKCLVRVSFTV